MKILEHNVETGEVLERNATAEEIAQIKSRKIEAETKELEAEAKAQAKAELLERLGITADEAKLLLA
jgi:hypothetical protein